MEEKGKPHYDDRIPGLGMRRRASSTMMIEYRIGLWGTVGRGWGKGESVKNPALLVRQQRSCSRDLRIAG